MGYRVWDTGYGERGMGYRVWGMGFGSMEYMVAVGNRVAVAVGGVGMHTGIEMQPQVWTRWHGNASIGSTDMQASVWGQ